MVDFEQVNAGWYSIKFLFPGNIINDPYMENKLLEVM